MDFPINAKAEGRILVPWEHRTFPNISQQDSSGAQYNVVTFFRLTFFQAVLRKCLGVNLYPIGVATETFGSLTAGPAILRHKLVASSALFADSPPSPLHLPSPTPTSEISMSPPRRPICHQSRSSRLQSDPTMSTTFAQTHGRDTCRATFSAIGVPSLFSIPYSLLGRYTALRTLKYPVIIITRPPRIIHMGGMRKN